MPERLLSTQVDPSGMRKFWLTLTAALLTAFATSYWNSQMAQSNVLYRLDKIEQQQEKLAEQHASTVNTANQNAIRLEQLAERQRSLIDELREFKALRQGR